MLNKDYWVLTRTGRDLIVCKIARNIYKFNKRGELLHKFINEAITKIKSNQNNFSQRKLSSNSQKD